MIVTDLEGIEIRNRKTGETWRPFRECSRCRNSAAGDRLAAVVLGVKKAPRKGPRKTKIKGPKPADPRQICFETASFDTVGRI